MPANVIAKRLTYRNNWENDIYYVDGKEIEDLYCVMISGIEYTVSSRMVSVSYSDMGHTYSSRSKHYFIKQTVFGAQQEFDLNTLVKKVKVFALGWKDKP